MLFQVDSGNRRGVRVLRARRTRHFVYLLVRCRCGKTFGHRADRRTIVCYFCGRMAELRLVRERTEKARGTGKAPVPSKARVAKGRPGKRQIVTATAPPRRARLTG